MEVLLIVLFECNGAVHQEFLPQGRKINKEYYLEVMRRFREAFCQKRTKLWKSQSWIMHHDKAPAHTLILVREFLAKNKTVNMSQPLYSPDLISAHFLLFPKLKTPMKGKRFAAIEGINEKSEEYLLYIYIYIYIYIYNWPVQPFS